MLTFQTGELIRFMAGAAPDPSVAPLVGMTGTVLRCVARGDEGQAEYLVRVARMTRGEPAAAVYRMPGGWLEPVPEPHWSDDLTPFHPQILEHGRWHRDLAREAGVAVPDVVEHEMVHDVCLALVSARPLIRVAGRLVHPRSWLMRNDPDWLSFEEQWQEPQVEPRAPHQIDPPLWRPVHPLVARRRRA